MKIKVITGPTASGKSQYVIDHFPHHDIINADSMQLYKNLPTLSARPKETHHLYGILEPNQEINVDQWSQMALNCIKQLERPIIVGGSGFYIKTLLEGISPMPPVDHSIVLEIEAWSSLFEKAVQVDPLIAQNLHPNDRQRIIRAASVKMATNISIFDWQKVPPKKPQHDFEVILVMPNRNELRRNIMTRLTQMLDKGAIEEVSELSQKYENLSNLPISRILGVKQILDYLNNNITLEQTKELIYIKTCQYAKRQMTWFRNKLKINSLDSFPGL